MAKIKVDKHQYFKGKNYKLIGVVKSLETKEELIAYQVLNDKKSFGYGQKRCFYKR